MNITQTLSELEASGNFRRIPSESREGVTDLSSNDYLGLAEREDLREEFFSDLNPKKILMSASASRLLGAHQREYTSFERTLGDAYGRAVLLFNSGYHANVGLVQAVADKQTLIVADRLVHASIIDGIRLSGAPFERFRHNDYDHLERILRAKSGQYANVLIIAESVYSMDGDRSDIDRLVAAKRMCGGKALLYVDEAHAVGASGPAGLGLVAGSSSPGEVDILVGTLGKALASAGAYAILGTTLRDFMVNRARSLIFSTALPPVNVEWSEFIFRRMLGMDSERRKLERLSRSLAAALGVEEASYIRPLIVGDAHRAVAMSERLLEHGFKVLPIRTPTVPPGTERLRFSLSAAIEETEIERLAGVLSRLSNHNERHA